MFFVEGGYFDVAVFCPPALRARLDHPPDEDKRELVQTLCHLDCRFVREVLARLKYKAPCLCCAYAPEGKVRELAMQLATIRGYFTYSSYEGTAACRRLSQALVAPPAAVIDRAVRDLAIPKRIRKAVRLVQKAGQTIGWCVRQNELWFADNPEVNRVIRRVSRQAKKVGGSLRVGVPSSRRLLTLPAPGAVRCVRYFSADGQPLPSIESPDHPIWMCIIAATEVA